MVPKHTPGPWKWDGYALVPEQRDPAQHAVHTILDVENFAWGFVGADLTATGHEDDANRDLIAAAPELLKVAQQVYDDLTTHGEVRAVTSDILAAAIAKATGA